MTAPERPVPASGADGLEYLIAECERRDWEWRLERVLEQDAPDSWVFTRIASVRPLAWRGEVFDDTDEDGWFGLSDDNAAGSMTDLLQTTMRWANKRTNPHARVDVATQAARPGEEQG